MKTKQIHLKKNSDFAAELKKMESFAPQLVFVFGGADEFASGGSVAKLKSYFPNATMLGCSTAGEISTNGVYDNTVVITATHFDSDPQIFPVSEKIQSMDDSYASGERLAKKLKKEGLKAIFILSRGLEVNGSAVISGIRSVVGDNVVLTGGLAGDGGKFQKTFTVLNESIQDDSVVGVGIYGENINVSYGSAGGWESFGPVRKVTKAKGNMLFELDGEPALDIYKKYLGEKAKDLPASGLLYPFAVLKDNHDSSGIIRTILAVDEATKSLTLAGDIQESGLVRLMHSNNEGLVAGAQGAAEQSKKQRGDEDGLALLISCVGRKLVMGQDIEDELEAVQSVFGDSMVAGFYSYGEICPQNSSSESKLHNQTMTITYLTEKKLA